MDFEDWQPIYEAIRADFGYDRAAFLADHLGAARLSFPGWDFDDPGVGAEKRRKLRWAARLLAWLERRRDERFSVLDSRRGALESLPGEG